MAVLQCSMQAAISAASVLATSSLPAAFYGSRVCSRAYSRAQHLLQREKDAEPGSRNRNHAWAFPLAARELVREAGGFAGGRRWPLGNRPTLLGRTELLHPTSPLSLSRQYSILPKSAEPPTATHTVCTAALDLPEQQAPQGGVSLLQGAGLGLSQWFSKVRLGTP